MHVHSSIMPPKSRSASSSSSQSPNFLSTESALSDSEPITPAPTPTSTPRLSPPRSPGLTPTPGSSPSPSAPLHHCQWRHRVIRNPTRPRPPRSRSRTPPPHLPQRPTPSPDSGPWSGYHPGVRTPSFTSYPATPRASPPSSGGGSLPDPSPPRALDQRSPTEVDYILASTFQTTPTPPSPSSFTPLLSPAGNTTADAPTPSPL